MNRLAAVQRSIILKSGLSEFIPRVWPLVEPGVAYKHNWHIDSICHELEEITAGRNRWLTVNIPPGGMKSLLVCVLWPCWEWLKDPTMTYAFWSFDAGLTKRDADRSLKILQSEWWLERFSDICLVPGDPAASDFSNLQGGWRFASSVDGKATGRHPRRRIIDDPSKPQETTKVMLEHVRGWHGNTIASRGDATTVAEVLIMQRLHDLDLSAKTIASGYRHLRFPMRYEPNSPSLGDPRVREGELFWEERFPEVEVKRLEKEMGPQVAAAQLQQRPQPEGGLVFKKGMAVRYKGLPTLNGISCMSVDCSFKDLQTSDYVSIGVWTMYRGKFFCTYRKKAQMGYAATVAAVKAVRRRFPKETAKILIEDKANGPAVVETLKKELSGVEEVNPEGGKVSRANAVSGFWESGDIHFPEEEKNPVTDRWEPCLWADDMIEEIESFPTGAHDDDVDMMSQAITWLYQKANRLREAMARAKEQMDKGQNPLGFLDGVFPEGGYGEY